MKVLASKLYQRITHFTLASALVISMFAGAIAPFISSSSVFAAPGNAYTATNFGSLSLTPDRFAPSGGYTTTGGVLTENVDNTHASTGGTFYQTEGLQGSVATSRSIKAELYVDSSWTGKSVRAGLWGVTKNDNVPADTAWPVIEYTTVGFTGFRVFDTVNGGWTNLTGVSATPGQWYNLEIAYNSDTKNYDYYVNDVNVLSLTAKDGSDIYRNFTGVIFNNYNFATNITADNYSVQWRNFSRGIFAAPSNLRLNGNQACEYATNVNFITPTWDAVPGAVSYNYKVTLPDSTVYGPTNVANVTSVSGAFGAEGTSTFSVQAVDADGATSEWATPCAVTYDATAPTAVTLTAPADNASQNVNDFYFTWNAPVGDTGSALHYEFQSSQSSSQTGGVLDTNVWLNTASPSAEQNYLPLPQIHSTGANGTWYWQARAVDAAGNVGPWSTIWTLNIDFVAPTADFVFPTPGPSATSFDVQFSEDVNAADAVNQANYFLDNWPGAAGSGDLVGDATIVYNPANHKATVTFTNAGWYVSPEQQWRVQNIHDLAGNLLNPNPTTEYSTAVVNPTDPGTPTATTPTNLTSVDWTWTASNDPAPASGVKGYYYELKKGSDVITPSTFTTDNFVTTSSLAEGTYTLSVYAIDWSGQTSGTATGSVVIDTTAPTFDYNGTTQSGNVLTPDLAILGDYDSFTWTADFANPTGVTFDDSLVAPDFTVTQSGDYKFVLRAVDAAGNDSEFVLTFTYTIPAASGETTPPADTTAPAAPAFTGIIGATAADQGVLGATDTNTDATSTDGTTDVKGASITKDVAEAISNSVNGNVLGLAWYWWLLILLAIGGIAWWIIGAIRNRGADNA